MNRTVLLGELEVRKTKAQKAAFRDWLCRTLTNLGYTPRVEEAKGPIKSYNVVAGDPEGAKVLLTAHYDTCAVLPVPNFITPENLPLYFLWQIILVVGMIALGGVAEVGLLLLWPSCPMFLAMGGMYLVVLFCLWWMLAGPANKHTANDNTSGVLTLLSIARAIPPEQRDQVCLVWFDNEEKGLFGSAAFAKAHPKARTDTLVLNFDCVSDGDHLRLYPSRALKGDPCQLDKLDRVFQGRGKKDVRVVRRFAFYPSDQRFFRLGVGVCALKHRKFVGYYMDRIHTRRDTVLDGENISLLTEGVLSLLQKGDRLCTPTSS